MNDHKKKLTSIAVAAALNCLMLGTAQAQSGTSAEASGVTTLPVVTIKASADASAQGLSSNYAGGQVARGGRAGILGTRDNLETPFAITAYTNELIQDRQAKSVADVLLNDPGVRVARGFGNFQETYFIRGFILGSDDIAYNGLYSLLPRQYIAAELFERVEVLRGASAFLMGASPSGGGLGGNVNLLPKRAPNETLTRVTVGAGSGSQYSGSLDVARRFGPDKATGLRFNAAYRDGGSAVADENAETGLASLGLDWHSRDVRLSGDIGWQDNKLQRTRTSVTVQGLGAMPALPDTQANFAQPWSYSNERDLFGTLRGEVDLGGDMTAWAAYGMRRSEEANLLANLAVTDAATGAGNFYRFDNAREDSVDTGEIGLRGKGKTGSVGHEWVLSASYFALDTKNGFAMDFLNIHPSNLYAPVSIALPPISSSAYIGNTVENPKLNTRTRLSSIAVGDTLAMLDQQLLLTLGARHQQLKVDSISTDVSFFGNFTAGGVVSSYDESRTSPVVGAVFKASQQLSVYANYIEGISKGDSLPAFEGSPARTLAPYVTQQKEVGLKYDAGRIGFGAAWFATDKPRALQSQDQAQGEDRHRGVELTSYGEAMRGLKLLGGLTWLDATQHGTGSAATEGKHTLGIPELQGNMGLEWEVAGVDGLALDGRVVYTGRAYADSANTLAVPSWTRLDIGARYLFELQGSLLTARARIDNLANKKYWASAGGYPDQSYLVIGAPRTLSVSLSADF